MKNPHRAALAFLLALGLFGSLVYATLGDNYDEVDHAEQDSRRVYGMGLELRGDLAGHDHVVIRDTLAHYSDQLIAETASPSGEWSMTSCCEELPAPVFQWIADLQFESPGDRFYLLERLQRSQFLDVELVSFEDQVLVGIASAHLPVPGSQGTEWIALESIGFNLRTSTHTI